MSRVKETSGRGQGFGRIDPQPWKEKVKTYLEDVWFFLPSSILWILLGLAGLGLAYLLVHLSASAKAHWVGMCGLWSGMFGILFLLAGLIKALPFSEELLEPESRNGRAATEEKPPPDLLAGALGVGVLGFLLESGKDRR